MNNKSPIALFLTVGAAFLVASCSMTARMEVPQPANATPIEFDQPVDRQASFSLTKVFTKLRRGTVIAHYPGSGVEDADGVFCNMSQRGEATLEWQGRRSFLGDWDTELGTVFYEVMNERNLNVAGDPKDVFDRGKSAMSAEYLVSARITDIKGNICSVHEWGVGPIGRYSSEMYVAVEWTVYSSLLKRRVSRIKTEGYFKQKKAKRHGVWAAFSNAFAQATENLTGSKKFVHLILRKQSDQDQKVAIVRADRMVVRTKKLRHRPLTDNFNSVRSAVVTLRVGRGTGSGFAISADGLIMTNAHVVGKARNVAVILSNGLELVGKVLRSDEVRDVALVKVPLRIPNSLPIRDRAVTVTEKVYAVGTPMDESLRSTVSTGIVSAVRTYARTGLSIIQSDVAISPGNSGGPLLDVNGNVVGVSVSQFVGPRSQNLNFFIPIMSAFKALNLKKVVETN